MGQRCTLQSCEVPAEIPSHASGGFWHTPSRWLCRGRHTPELRSLHACYTFCAYMPCCAVPVAAVVLQADSTLPVDQRRNYKGVVDAMVSSNWQLTAALIFVAG